MINKNENGLVADHNNKSQITNVSLTQNGVFLAFCMFLVLVLEIAIAFGLNYKMNIIEEGLKSDIESFKVETNNTISGIKYKLYKI